MYNSPTTPSVKPGPRAIELFVYHGVYLLSVHFENPYSWKKSGSIIKHSLLVKTALRMKFGNHKSLHKKSLIIKVTTSLLVTNFLYIDPDW